MIQLEFPWKSGLETFKRDLFSFLQSLDEPGVGGDRMVNIIAGHDLKPAIAVMLGLNGEPCYDPVQKTLCGYPLHFNPSGDYHRRVSAYVLSPEDVYHDSVLACEVDPFSQVRRRADVHTVP